MCRTSPSEPASRWRSLPPSSPAKVPAAFCATRAESTAWPVPASNRPSSLQQVYRLPDVGHAHVPRQRRMLPLDRLIHLPGNAAVGKMSLWRGAQLADVEGLREIHLKERAEPRAQRQQVARGGGSLRSAAPAYLCERLVRRLSRCFIRPHQARFG